MNLGRVNDTTALGVRRGEPVTLSAEVVDAIDEILCDGRFQDSNCRWCALTLEHLRHAIGDDAMLYLLHLARDCTHSDTEEGT